MIPAAGIVRLKNKFSNKKIKKIFKNSLTQNLYLNFSVTSLTSVISNIFYSLNVLNLHICKYCLQTLYQLANFTLFLIKHLIFCVLEVWPYNEIPLDYMCKYTWSNYIPCCHGLLSPLS